MCAPPAEIDTEAKREEKDPETCADVAVFRSSGVPGGGDGVMACLAVGEADAARAGEPEAYSSLISERAGETRGGRRATTRAARRSNVPGGRGEVAIAGDEAKNERRNGMMPATAGGVLSDAVPFVAALRDLLRGGSVFTTNSAKVR